MGHPIRYQFEYWKWNFPMCHDPSVFQSIGCLVGSYRSTCFILSPFLNYLPPHCLHTFLNRSLLRNIDDAGTGLVEENKPVRKPFRWGFCFQHKLIELKWKRPAYAYHVAGWCIMCDRLLGDMWWKDWGGVILRSLKVLEWCSFLYIISVKILSHFYE